uniref:ATP synthase subunit a n=1 Tax=Modiolus modiolus TaxID=40256 RepID=A0A1L7H856_MODMO|nr:ATP synthase F0 subunit 6 [Modiolus modiolus]APU51259.1 ATP synthase F0 subunit 6 [Modiolus modiolus]
MVEFMVEFVMLDLLSSFDSFSMSSISCGPLWISMGISLFVLIGSDKGFVSFSEIVLHKILSVGGSLSRGMTGQFVSGFSISVISLFVFLIMVNLLGLVPFSFSVSSQVGLGPSMAFFMWLCLWLSGLRVSWRQTLCTLVPSYAPMFLIPFLLLVEVVTISSRPVTLGLRLMINLTAGHLIMGMLTNVNTNVVLQGFMVNLFCSAYGFQFLGLIASMSLLSAEMVIGGLQAFIFCTLLGLYSNEHPS